MPQPEKKITSQILHQPILLVSLGLTFLNFGLPIYAKALGASALEIGGLFSIFTFMLVLLRPLIGQAIDRAGRKAFLVAGLAAYAVSLGVFALAASLPGFYAARLIQGIASAMTWIAVSTIVADLAGVEERGKEIGAINGMGARGEVIGALVGFGLLNYFSEVTGWKIAFLGYSLMAAAAVWLVWRKVPETRPALAGKTDQPGKLAAPRAFYWLLAVVFVTTLSQSLLGPIYLVFLQDRFTADAGTLAFAFLPAGIVFSLLSSRLGSLSDRLGRAPLMAIGLAGSGLLNWLLPGLPNLIWLTAIYTLSAVGWAMAGPAESALVADLAGTDQRGRAYGWYQFTGSLGATIGPLFGGWLYDRAGHAFPFTLTGVICLAGAAWVLVTLRSPRIKYPEPRFQR